MNSRERLRRAYFHEEMDRPGVYSRRGFPDGDPSYDRLKDYLHACSDLKLPWNGEAIETPYQSDHSLERHSEDFQRHLTTLRTPAGDLQASRLVSLRGQPGLNETFFIKTNQDAEKYLSLPMPIIQGDTSSFFTTDEQVGDRGIVEVDLGLNPAGCVVELFGSEAFAIASITDRDVIHALCRRRMAVKMDAVKFLLSHQVGPFFTMLGQEYVTPPLHGPRDFHDFNVAYDKPIVDLIHDGGGRMHIHCHGRIKTVMQAFVDMGADVLHPFEAPPMGDITPAEAKALAGDRLCLEGNIQIGHMYEHTPEEIRRETTALIESVFSDKKGLIVSPTASPYIRDGGGACFQQYKAMIDAVGDW